MFSGPIEGTVDFINYVEGLAELVIPGVVRDYGMEPPQSLNTADMPAKFLRLPVESRSRFALAIDGADAHGSGMMTVEVVVVLQPVAQDLPEPNFTSTVEMCDAMTKALVKADVALSWPEAVSVAVRPDIDVGGFMHWAVVASVTARG